MEDARYHKLRDLDLLKYIEGPFSRPPNIPTLQHTTAQRGFDDDGNASSFHALGQEDEYEQALTDTAPWMAGNNTTLARIVAAIPLNSLHLVEHARYAKDMWNNLLS